MNRPMNEKDYQAQDDAYTLARAQQIKDDPARSAAADKALEKIAAEKQEEAEAAMRAKITEKREKAPQQPRSPKKYKVTKKIKDSAPRTAQGKSGAFFDSQRGK